MSDLAAFLALPDVPLLLAAFLFCALVGIGLGVLLALAEGHEAPAPIGGRPGSPPRAMTVTDGGMSEDG